MQYVMPTYGRQPITFSHGEGAWLWDTAGKRYLDALCGIAVTGLGHAHPRITAALSEQAGRLIHSSNLYHIKAQEELAERLCTLAAMDNVFFCNSGAEANEAAIKIARLYGHRKDVSKPSIVVMEQSFHGRTMATLSATGSRKVQAGFEPLLAGFARVPYNDVAAVELAAANNPDIVAILVEPVQGEGGINIPDDNYLPALREICDRNNWLLMLDEVQSGMGRTGAWFAHQLSGIKPDVMTLAKGLGNGFPIGACLARGAAAEVLQPGSHGSTFGGNPLASVAAMTTLSIIEEENLLPRATALGDEIVRALGEKLSGVPGIRELRNKGLMIAIELEQPCGELVARGLDAGLLINVTADKVLRLLPPLILSDEQVQILVDGVAGLITTFTAASAVETAE
ncbi:MAG: aspartate aminotransferase family protein [Betaproteobacteria bacterium]|nr:MAG: aspartate aminotransferase family protein [Betaproteobacteria bacterium]